MTAASENRKLTVLSMVGLQATEAWSAFLRRLLSRLVDCAEPDSEWFAQIENAILRPLLPHGVSLAARELAFLLSEKVGSIVQAHTTLPLHLPFLPSYLRDWLARYVEHGDGSATMGGRTGTNGLEISANRMHHRLCVSCVREMLDSDVGHAIWRLIWALPWVEVCNTHDELLAHWCTDCDAAFAKCPYPVLPEIGCYCGKELRFTHLVTDRTFEYRRSIADDIRRVANGSLLEFSSDNIRQAMHDQAAELELHGNAGTRRARELFIDSGLNAVAGINFGSRTAVFVAILQGKQLSVSPYANLFALRALFGSLDQAIVAIKTAKTRSGANEDGADDERIAAMRSVVAGVIQRSGSLRRVELRKAVTQELAYFEHYDVDWLAGQLGEKQISRLEARRSDADAKYAAKILTRVAELKNDKLGRRRSVRQIAQGVISVAVIYRCCREKYPRTWAAIFGNVETRESYVRRKYAALAERFPECLSDEMPSTEQDLNQTPVPVLQRWTAAIQQRRRRREKKG